MSTENLAPEEIWLHDMGSCLYDWVWNDEPEDVERDVRYVRADRYVRIEAALGVQEMKDARIAELEAALTQMSNAHRETAADLGEEKALIRELEAALEKQTALLEASGQWKLARSVSKTINEQRHQIEKLEAALDKSISFLNGVTMQAAPGMALYTTKDFLPGVPEKD